MKKIEQLFFALCVVVMGLAFAGGMLYLAQDVFAQDAGRRRQPGIVFTRGSFIELTAGAAVAAGDALYLDSAGKVQKSTSAQAANLVGVADNTAANGETVRVQISGIATVTADGAVTIGDKVGATGLTNAGRLVTVSNTLAIGAGATAVTSTAANGAIVTGDPVVSRVFGRALTAAAGAASTFTVLITPQ